MLIWAFSATWKHSERNFRPMYVAAAEGVNPGMTLAWWSTHGNKIPSWKKAARRVFAISPTSAAVERVFSNLNAYVSNRQEQTLDDFLNDLDLLEKTDRRDHGVHSAHPVVYVPRHHRGHCPV